MDELIARLVADVGIDRATAEKAVGIILEFLVKEGPADKVQPLLAKLPGAEAVMQRTATENESGGLMAGAHDVGWFEYGPGAECNARGHCLYARESRRGCGWRDRRRDPRARAVCLSTNLLVATKLR